MKHRWVLTAVLVLGGCSSAPAEPPWSPTWTGPPVAEAPPASSEPAPPSPVEPAPSADACGASKVQHLIGHPRSEVPVPLEPNLQRVACNTCPVTQDYNPRRLNFFFDAASGRITEIRCG